MVIKFAISLDDLQTDVIEYYDDSISWDLFWGGSSVFNIQSQRSCRSLNELQSGGIEDNCDQTVNG